MKFTGVRLTRRDDLLLRARLRQISWDTYHKRVATLERQEVKYQEKKKQKEEEKERKREEKEKARQAQIAENRRLGQIKRKETIEKKKEEKKKQELAKKKIAGFLSKKIKEQKEALGRQLIRKFDFDGEVTVREIWKMLRGTSVNEVRILANGFDKTVGFDDYKKFRMNFVQGGSDGDFIVAGRVLVVKPSQFPAKKLMQKYRDGVQHCIFVPIINKLVEKLENSNSKESQKRYKQRINKMKEFIELYEDGVPEDKMEEVAKASGLLITVNDVLGKVIKTYNENGKVGTLKLTNTRENHVDEGSIVMDGEFEEVSEYQMQKIWREVRNERKFYHVEGDIRNDMPVKLNMLDKAFKLKDEEKDILNEFDKKINIAKYRLNATKFPEANAFIKAGRIVNGWPTELNGGSATGHIDMPKAYAHFKKCDYYSGFLGVIHQFRSGNFSIDWIKEHIGMYRFTVLKCENKLFSKLGMTVGSVHILPSPEICYFVDNGVEVAIDAGVFGSKFDFEFDDEMLENRRYCTWSGRCGMERAEKSYTFPGSIEFAGHLKATLPEGKVLYWGDKGLITIKVPVKNVFTAHHILAFITSYTRIQMLQAMSKFKYEQLVKVVMDGIFFVGEMPDELSWFSVKEIKEHQCLEHWYDNVDLEVNWKPVTYSKNTVVAGQGGAGKTYNIMTDGCFNKILYVCPQHVLGQRTSKQYGENYTTIHQLIGLECVPYIKKYSYPPVIIIDELTQMESSWVDKALEMYKDSLILILGDVNKNGMWFQTRNGKPGDFGQVWKPVGVDFQVVEGDRRSRDEELKQLKIKIRAVMEKIFIDGDSGEELAMKAWAYNKMKVVSFEDACQMFEEGDTCIAGTHKTNAKLLEKGIVSGYYRKGGWISAEEKDGFEKRGSFTIHSYQGSTVEKGKIFIFLEDMFEFTMFYTAISRAVHFNQLVFVGK